MLSEVKIPPLGESLTGGILTTWHVKEGDVVEENQLLFELETDKITSEGLANAAGRIHLKAKEGEEVTIGQVVATIEAITISLPTTPSPAVRRLAAETDLNPQKIQGTGKGGRVTKGDLLTALALERKPVSPDRTSRKKMSPLRLRIAERLVAAQNNAAILTTFNEVDMSEVLTLRRKHQEDFLHRYRIKLGLMSFFVKAVVSALKNLPIIHAQIEGEEIIFSDVYDIGIAVSTEKGLVVPVLRNCESLHFSELEQQIADYATRARSGKIKIEELRGGTFTLSNAGIYGSLFSTPLLNFPQSAILGIHHIKERPVAINGKVEIRPMMYLALSYDHRLIDGKEAVLFVTKIKETIENPLHHLWEE